MNRSQFPNGGWQFFQQQTGWWAPAPVGNTFDQQVTNIIKHRLANWAVTAAHKLSVDVNQVGVELETFNAKRLGLDIPKTLPPPPVRQSVSGVAQLAVDAVKKMAAGAATFLDWEQNGLPAEPAEVSAGRAAVCAVCPKNQLDGFSRNFTAPVAERIRRLVSKLNNLNLTTPDDAKLGVCSACLCELRLKVHTPSGLILKRLKPEERADLDPNCWILKLK